MGFVSAPEAVGSYLGDVVIALPFTRRQAAQSGTTLNDELRLLVVHGVLHLLGYDHDSDEMGTAGRISAQPDMWARQKQILDAIAALDSAPNGPSLPSFARQAGSA